TIKVVSRHQATQQYGAILPIELTTAEIRNSKAYQEYYACAMGEEVGSHKEGKESNDDSDDGSDKDYEKTVKSGAGKDGDDDDDEDDDDDDEEEETAKDDEELKETGTGGDEVRESGGSEEEEVSFDPIPRTPEDSEKESDDEEEQELRLSEEARIQEEEDAEELYRDVNVNQGKGLQVTQSVEDTHVILTPVNPDD
nr:hypothetical protein [Tanacetum cinerariifolium]